MEQWKDINGYKGLYQVSNFGRVKSLDRKVKCGYEGNGVRLLKGKFLKPYIATDGYYYILVSKKDKTKHFAIHRLIALHFIHNPHNFREVNHIDFDRLNNKIDNLQWVTPKENINHSRKAGRMNIMNYGECNHSAKLKEPQVLEIRKLKLTHTEIAKIYGVSRKCISKIINKETWPFI